MIHIAIEINSSHQLSRLSYKHTKKYKQFVYEKQIHRNLYKYRHNNYLFMNFMEVNSFIVFKRGMDFDLECPMKQNIFVVLI